jgi:D-lactate dehydrogenase
VAVLGRLKPPPVERPEGAAAPDRAPDWVADGTPEPLRSELIALLGADRLRPRPIDLVSYASDASPYRMIPQAVVVARDADDVAKVIRFGRDRGIGVTFRGGGTSLNGQGQGAGILVDVRRNFGGVEALDDGHRVRVRPGTILGHANRVLAPYGRKLGPDPASTDIATVGGVIANNSGGMRCGTTRDSYSTVRALTFVTPSGTVIDSAADGAEERFAEAEPELVAELTAVREEILADRDLVERIRKKFQIKNTMGYRLCAFLDAETPLEIFRRLLVGSEGTLAFIAEAVFETVPLPARTTLAWLHFPDVASAVAPVHELVEAGASAVELMVAPALIAAGYSIVGAPEYFKELEPSSAALLVEFGGADEGTLDADEAKALEILGDQELLRPVEFTRDAERVELYWRIREGLHGLAGRLRLPGTALIVEDVCVAPAQIAAATEDLRALLGEHGFLPGAAGHASAGNLHFMLTPDFGKQEDLDRYEAFMKGLVELVLDRYDGSLKAEHGTGVNMAPFVEREWGTKATELMWRVKRATDPDGVLGPGVLLSSDPGCHLKNLRTTPPIEAEATACVECGFCEPVCPSRHLTMTPRQRIVVRREMARQEPGSPVLHALQADYEYDGLETCAADGSCRLVCPVGIDTGKLVKAFRSAQHTDRAERVGLRVAKRWAGVERATRAGLRVGHAIAGVAGDPPLTGLSRAARRAVGSELAPEWGSAMPRAAAATLPETSRAGAAAVYLPACINRMFGLPDGASGPSVVEAMVEVSKRAGSPVWIPADVAGSCCATPWGSKGYARGHEWMANATVANLWRWSDAGELPIVIDASSCTHGLATEVADVLDEANAERHAELEIVDSVAWVERILPGLSVGRKLGSIAVHPTCSTRQLDLTVALARVAGALADEVEIPPAATCCGFAGDRGFLHPELTEAATRDEAAALAGRDFDAYVSSNRTCEVGLERGTGRPYRSVVQVLEELSRA